MIRKSFVLVPLLGLVFGFVGCSGENADAPTEGKGEEDNEPVDGKADSFFNPTEHGDLTFGVPAQAAFTDDEQFHAWTFSLTAAADVSLSSPNVTPNLDTVMYLYRRDAGQASWGRYIHRNDDFGGNIWSQIAERLDAGEYRVIVKAYKTSLRGAFRLEGACDGDGCPGAGSECNPEDVQPEVQTTDVTQACVNSYASVIASPVANRKNYRIAYPEHCALSGPERTAVEQYYAYWEGMVGWSSLVFEEDEVVGFDVEAQKLERGWVVRVDYGGDEMSLSYVFDAAGELVVYYHLEQSAQVFWTCNDGGAAIEEPGVDCVGDSILNMPHLPQDETLAGGTATVETAKEAMGFLGAFALDAYKASTGIADDAMVTYDAKQWSGYETVAEIRLEASGQPTITYALGGYQSASYAYATIYWARTGDDIEMRCERFGD